MLVTYATFLFIIVTRVYSQSYSNVVNLQTDVLAGYSKDVRPLLNQADLMHINITYDIGGIQEINEVEGTITIFLQLRYSWIDERIRWNPYFYNNTYTLALPGDSVWKPELILVNLAGSEISLDSSMTSVRYFPNGAALWFPSGVITVSCDVNIEFYPFDTQICPIMFMISNFFSTEMVIHAVNKEAALQYYIENGIWELVKTEGYASGDGVPMYTLNLSMARKPTFVVIIVIVPTMLLSFLSIMVFLLPPESGERMSYSITLLLALVVFLTIISDNIPKTSSPLSILSYFIGLHVLLSAMITLVTIFNLRTYYKDEQEPVPSWLCCCFRKGEVGLQYTVKGHEGQAKRPRKSFNPTSVNGEAFPAKPFVPIARHGTPLATKSNGGSIDWNNWQFYKTFDEDQPRSRTAEKAKPRVTWKDISRFIDCIMFILSIVYFVLVFVVFALVAVFRN